MNKCILNRKVSSIVKRLSNFLHKSALVNYNKRLVSLNKALRSIIRPIYTISESSPSLVSNEMMTSKEKAISAQYNKQTKLLNSILRRIKRCIRVTKHKCTIESAEVLLRDIDEKVNSYLLEEQASSMVNMIDDTVIETDMGFKAIQSKFSEVNEFKWNFFQNAFDVNDAPSIGNIGSFLF